MQKPLGIQKSDGQPYMSPPDKKVQHTVIHCVYHTTRPDKLQTSRGRLGRSSNAKTNHYSKMWRTDRRTDRPTRQGVESRVRDWKYTKMNKTIFKLRPFQLCYSMLWQVTWPGDSYWVLYCIYNICKYWVYPIFTLLFSQYNTVWWEQ